MSPQYLSPGVYVEEIDKGTKPIEGVGTAMAAFVGFAEKGPVNQPMLIASWNQFVATFGGFIKGWYLAPSVYGYFNNGGGSCYVTRLPGEVAPARGDGQAALPSRSEVVLEGLAFQALEGAAGEGEVTVEVSRPEEAGADQFNLTIRRGSVQETFENLSVKKGKGVRNVVEVVNKESKLVRVAERAPAIAMAPMPGSYPLQTVQAEPPAVREVSPSTVVGDAPSRSGVMGLEVGDDITIVCAPDLMSLYQAGRINLEGVQAVQQAMLDHCANMKDRFAILDCPPGMTPQQIKDWRMNVVNYDSKYGALYYPWIKVADPTGNGAGMLVPPSGHIAGVYARSDGERGVHKAPANEIIRGCVGLEYQVTKSEQDSLNPVGINCIRAFPGRGIRIWGARTLSSDASWRYINVRRLFNFIEKSIERGTQWIVFEPNDMDLWERIKRDITAFLTRVWRDGALFGATPQEAFYVKCDAELNTPEVRDAGQVIIEIGLAPVKPAEFVIFRISQYSGGAGIEE